MLSQEVTSGMLTALSLIIPGYGSLCCGGVVGLLHLKSPVHFMHVMLCMDWIARGIYGDFVSEENLSSVAIMRETKILLLVCTKVTFNLSNSIHQKKKMWTDLYYVTQALVFFILYQRKCWRLITYIILKFSVLHALDFRVSCILLKFKLRKAITLVPVWSAPCNLSPLIALQFSVIPKVIYLPDSSLQTAIVIKHILC